MPDRDKLAAALDDGMKVLAIPERNALLLAYFEGFPPEVAADAMSVSLDEYHRYLIAAKVKMRNYTHVFDVMDGL